MRKSSNKFQIKRSGGRAALSPQFSTSTGEALPRHRRDVAALTHQVVNDKSVQIAQNYGLANLLRKFGGFWLPRNTGKHTTGIDESARSIKELNDGLWGDAKGLFSATPRVLTEYYVAGVHA